MGKRDRSEAGIRREGRECSDRVLEFRIEQSRCRCRYRGNEDKEMRKMLKGLLLRLSEKRKRASGWQGAVPGGERG